MKPLKLEDYDPFKPEKKPRSWFWPKVVLFLGTSGVVAIAGVLYVASRTTPRSAALLPADTPGFVALTAGPATAWGLPLMRRAYPDAVSWDGYRDLKLRCRRDLGIELEADVFPWLGAEIAAAVLPVPKTRGGKGDATGCLLIATRDIGKSRACLAKIKAFKAATKGEAAHTERYENVNYDVYPDGAALGVVGRFVAVTMSDGAMSGLIDRAAGRERATLAREPGYQAMLAQLPGTAAVRAFVGVAAVQEGTRRYAPKSDLPGAQDGRAGIEAFRGMACALSASGNTASLEGVMRFDPERLPASWKEALTGQPVPMDLFRGLGPDAVVAGSVRLPPAFAQMAAGALRDGNRRSPVGAELARRAGVDLEKDLAPWLVGEVAAAVHAAPRGTTAPSWPFEAEVVMRPVDREAAEAGLTKLRAAASAGLAAPFAFKEEAQPDGTWWTMQDALAGKVWGGYGFTPDGLRVAFGPTQAALGLRPAPSLADDPAFHVVVDALPQRNAGLLFVDVARTREATRRYTGPLPAEAERALQPWRTLGMAGAPALDGQGFWRGVMTMQFEPPIPPEPQAEI